MQISPVIIRLSFVLLIAIAAAIIAVLLIVFKIEQQLEEESSYSSLYGTGAVASNGVECAAIGRDILERGGSAVDSAIAVLICEGIVCPQSLGIGGGFVVTVYIRETGEVKTLNARERAPLAATTEMYVDNPSDAQIGNFI